MKRQIGTIVLVGSDGGELQRWPVRSRFLRVVPSDDWDHMQSLFSLAEVLCDKEIRDGGELRLHNASGDMVTLLSS